MPTQLVYAIARPDCMSIVNEAAARLLCMQVLMLTLHDNDNDNDNNDIIIIIIITTTTTTTTIIAIIMIIIIILLTIIILIMMGWDVAIPSDHSVCSDRRYGELSKGLPDRQFGSSKSRSSCPGSCRCDCHC